MVATASRGVLPLLTDLIGQFKPVKEQIERSMASCSLQGRSQICKEAWYMDRVEGVVRRRNNRTPTLLEPS